MKAVYFHEHGGLDVIQYGDAPDPELKPGYALLRVMASACNPGDRWARRGFPGMAIPLPHIPGSDVAAVVEKLADDVADLKVGDEVVVYPGMSCRKCEACVGGEEFFCRDFAIYGQRTGPWDGAHAEYVAVPAYNCLKKPPSLSFDEAAALPVVLTTVWRQLVVRGGLKAGQTVLVWGGAGGMGSIAIQLCRIFGAEAIAVGSDREKLLRAEELGAKHVINRKEEDVLEAVRRITNKRGVDIVFEHVGKQTWPTSILAARRGGVITVSGATSGHDAVTDLRYVFVRHLSIHGSNLGSRADLEAALQTVESGRLKPVIHSRLPLAEHAKAQELLKSGEVIGKIIHPR